MKLVLSIHFLSGFFENILSNYKLKNEMNHYFRSFFKEVRKVISAMD